MSRIGKISVKLHVKRKPRRNDSMFYYGQHIATVKAGLKTIIVESSGEMKAYFDEKGDVYEGYMLAKELKSRNMTDRGLSTLGQKDMILMNNWFRIFSVNDPVDLNEEIAHTYDEAIEIARQKAVD
jgi:hypothetical protein